MYVETIWIVILGASGPIAGVVLFATHLLQVKKLQLEIEKLKTEKKESTNTVVRASPAEIEKFGKPIPSAPRRSMSGALFAVGLGLLSFPFLLLLSRDDQNSDLFKKHFGKPCLSKFEIDVSSTMPTVEKLLLCTYKDAIRLEIEDRVIFIPITKP